jgi:hypothetical protein
LCLKLIRSIIPAAAAHAAANANVDVAAAATPVAAVVDVAPAAAPVAAYADVNVILAAASVVAPSHGGAMKYVRVMIRYCWRLIYTGLWITDFRF